MTDWDHVGALASEGLLAAEIAARIGYSGHPSNLRTSAKRRGIVIRAMTFAERASLAGKIGGAAPKRRATERTAAEQRRYEVNHPFHARRWRLCRAPAPAGPVWPIIRKMLEDTHAAS